MCRDNSALTIEGTPTRDYYEHKKRKGRQAPNVPWCGELKISICIHLVTHQLNASNLSDHFDELIHDEHVNLDHGSEFNEFFHPRFQALVQRMCTKLQEKGACKKKTHDSHELVYDSLTLEWTQGNSGRSKCKAFLEKNRVSLQFRKSRFSASVEDERDTELNDEEGESGQDDGSDRDKNGTQLISTSASTNNINEILNEDPERACKENPRHVVETLVNSGNIKLLEKNSELTRFIPRDKRDEWYKHLNSPVNDSPSVLQGSAGQEAPSQSAIPTTGQGGHLAVTPAEGVPGAFPYGSEPSQSIKLYSHSLPSPLYPVLPSLAAGPPDPRRPARFATKKSQQLLGGDIESRSTDKSMAPTASSAYTRHDWKLPAATRHGEPLSASQTTPDPSRLSHEQLKARILVLTDRKVRLDKEVVQVACEIDILWAYWQFKSSSS